MSSGKAFWKQGYEGASLADLEAAMGINRKSMYAAFGNKEELFLQTLQRYSDGPAAYAHTSLNEPTARQVAGAFLEGAVRVNTYPGAPAGCLGVQAALVTGESARRVHDELVAWRHQGWTILAERFRRALDEGDLPPDADPGLLARYVMTVANGLAIQAVGGATREELQQVADVALKNWPPV